MPSAERRPLFVFGYGSLMWRPDFPHVARMPAIANGVSRALCVWSGAYRGSPERPGLVFGLDQDGVSETRGVVFEVAPEHRRSVVAYLFQRELIYSIYRPEMIDVEGEDGRRRRALAFVVDRDDPAYAGDLAREARIAAIAIGAGRAGRARDYLANALERLEAMSAPEPGLAEELAAADRLGDDPALLFRLLDERARRRLDLVFEAGHEGPAV